MISANSRLASCLRASGSRRSARSVLKNMKLTNCRWVAVASVRAGCAWGSTVVVMVEGIVSLSHGPDARRTEAFQEYSRHAAVQRFVGRARIRGGDDAAPERDHRSHERPFSL